MFVVMREQTQKTIDNIMKHLSGLTEQALPDRQATVVDIYNYSTYFKYISLSQLGLIHW